MEPNSFELLLNYKRFTIPSRFDRLTKVSAKVYNILIFSSPHQYNIESNVSEDVLQSYIKYWTDEDLPEVTISNFYEFYHLNQEFDLLTDFLENKKLEFGKDLQYYYALKESDIHYQSCYEEIISKNLDEYLERYGAEMMKLPTQTLFNIFNHQQRKLANHNLAYSLIQIEFKRSKNSAIFVLIQCLDASKLSKENFEDSICHRSLHCNFVPEVKSDFLESAFQKQKEMENEILQLNKLVSQQKTELSQFILEMKKNHDNEINELKELIKNQANDNLNNERKSSTQINKLKSFMKDIAIEISNKLGQRENEIINLKCKIDEINKKNSDQDKEISSAIQKFDGQISQINQSIQNESLNAEIEELKKSVKSQSDKINNIDEKQQNSLNSINENIKENQIKQEELIKKQDNQMCLLNKNFRLLYTSVKKLLKIESKEKQDDPVNKTNNSNKSKQKSPNSNNDDFESKVQSIPKINTQTIREQQSNQINDDQFENYQRKSSKQNDSKHEVPRINTTYNDSLKDYQEFYSPRLLNQNYYSTKTHQQTKNIPTDYNQSKYSNQNIYPKYISPYKDMNSRNTSYSNAQQMYGIPISQIKDDDLYSPGYNANIFHSSEMPKLETFECDSDDDHFSRYIKRTNSENIKPKQKKKINRYSKKKIDSESDMSSKSGFF